MGQSKKNCFVLQEVDGRVKQEVAWLPKRKYFGNMRSKCPSLYLFLENWKTRSNLNESQASNSMLTEPEDQFEGSKAEGTPGQSERHIDVDAGKKRGDQDNIADGGKASDAETPEVEKPYKQMK